MERSFPTNNQHSITFFNVNSDRRLNPKEIIGRSFNELTGESRYPDVINYIFTQLDKNNIICLCEIDSLFIELLTNKLLQKKEYKMIYNHYNSDKGSFYFVIIFCEEKYKLIESKLLCLTSDGKPIADEERVLNTKAYGRKEYEQRTLFDNFEKGALLTKFIDNVSNESFLIIITHIGLSNRAKLAQASKILEYLSEYKDESIIFGGDLNAFNSEIKEPVMLMDLINIFKNNGWNWRTKELETTIRVYPFDIFFKLDEEDFDKYHFLKNLNIPKEFRSFCEEKAKEKGTDGLALDHIFTWKFEKDIKITTELPYEKGVQLSDHYLVKMQF